MKKLLFPVVLASALSIPVLAQADPKYLGEIFTFAGNYCPEGTLEAKGQLLNITANNSSGHNNTALFTILGTTYGGDGRSTFALPNLTAKGESDKPKVTYCVVINGMYPARVSN